MAKSARDAPPFGSRAGSGIQWRIVLAACLMALPLGSAAGQAGSGGKNVTPKEYEGWRQYSVHCARCHGQDVLGNPVAANLLKSTAEGGPAADEATFVKIVLEGRPAGGMPPLRGVVTPEQASAIYAYVKGRADGRIPPGRPQGPKK